MLKRFFTFCFSFLILMVTNVYATPPTCPLRFLVEQSDLIVVITVTNQESKLVYVENKFGLPSDSYCKIEEIESSESDIKDYLHALLDLQHEMHIKRNWIGHRFLNREIGRFNYKLRAHGTITNVLKGTISTTDLTFFYLLPALQGKEKKLFIQDQSYIVFLKNYGDSVVSNYGMLFNELSTSIHSGGQFGAIEVNKKYEIYDSEQSGRIKKINLSHKEFLERIKQIAQ